MKAIVLAGGEGTRLWPLSRPEAPKQLHKLIDDRSLLMSTIDRIRPVFSHSDIIVMTGKKHAEAVIGELEGLGIKVIIEPCRRDTLGAIGTAIAYIARDNPEDSFVVINSDAYVKDVNAYHQSLRDLDLIVRAVPDRLILTGLKPTRPETGYGYIEMGEEREVAGVRMREVIRFKEKPALAQAQEFVRSGRFLWNPSMLCGSVKTFISAVRLAEPIFYTCLEEMRQAAEFDAVIEQVFDRMPTQNIDRGVLERQTNMLVLPADWEGWTDVGAWNTIYECSQKDASGNVLLGDVRLEGVSGSLVRNESKRIVAVVGLEGVVVVETDDATLILSKERAQDVKKIVEQIKADSKLE